MKVQVLGTGCPKCKKLYAEAEKAVASSGVAADLEKVEKIDDIMKIYQQKGDLTPLKKEISALYAGDELSLIHI